MKTPFLYFCKLITFPIANIFTQKIKGMENIPKEGPFIIASNHNNSLDIWFIGNTLKERIRNLRFVAAMDNFKILLMSGLLYYFANAIVINRRKEGREEILNKIVETLKDNKIVALFPEGNTSHRKDLLRGKTGIAEIVFKTGVPVIPMGLRILEGTCKRIVEIGPPLFLKESVLNSKIENNKEGYNLLLKKATDKIMQEISKLSHKPYPYAD